MQVRKLSHKKATGCIALSLDDSVAIRHGGLLMWRGMLRRLCLYTRTTLYVIDVRPIFGTPD